ncbi:MAG: hypothetical protein F6J92_00415 [Symploca sp. SIO1A3]|nr:hypothetical protein [Symploca sp. SIO1A3]
MKIQQVTILSNTLLLLGLITPAVATAGDAEIRRWGDTETRGQGEIDYY